MMIKNIEKRIIKTKGLSLQLPKNVKRHLNRGYLTVNTDNNIMLTKLEL
ncbi:MAG: hypothetical protein KatS3mg003_0935 [Candidatus Nitrosocaldaceae archaeon]|nr:MAG: hypothetical protein KatS3mg003_0935 [Candidatus Nitrosocaldaceae archaeon]